MKANSIRLVWLTPFATVAVLALCLHPQPAQAGLQRRFHHTRYEFPSVGLAPGQTVHVSLTTLRAVPPDPCRIFLIGNDGSVLGDSGTIQLPAVQRTFGIDFDRAKITAGDGSVRVQVRAVVAIEHQGFFAPPCRPSLEIVDNETGETKILGTPPAPDQID